MATKPSTPQEPSPDSTDGSEQDRAATQDALTNKVQHLKTIPRADDAGRSASASEQLDETAP